MKFAFYTLGCKTNQYETQAMERILTEMGHEIGHFDEHCDGYVVNTCSVTAVADKKNRAVIRRCRRENPDAVIAVCGCYPQTHPGDMEDLSIDLVSGTGDRLGFVELLEQTCRHRFRDGRDINQYLFAYYQLLSGRFAPTSRRKTGRVLSGAWTPEEAAWAIGRYKMVCINDTVPDFEAAKSAVNAAFESLLPNKSSFEL